eukprot:4116061-Prorocentrum_lima.AAC.1
MANFKDMADIKRLLCYALGLHPRTRLSSRCMLVKDIIAEAHQLYNKMGARLAEKCKELINHKI